MKKINLLLLVFSVCCTVVHAQNVGINTTAPTSPLTVQANGDMKGIIQKNGTVEVGFWTSASSAFVQTWTANNLNFATNNGNEKITLLNSNGFVGINNSAPTAQLDINGTLRIRGNGAAAGNVLTSDINGNATWQAPAGGGGVAFSAFLSASVPLTNVSYTPVSFTEDFDDGGNNFSAGVFTAPSAGTYQFVVNIGWGSTTTGNNNYYLTRILLTNAGTTNSIIAQFGQPVTAISGYGINLPATVIYKLSAGDKISLEVSHTGAASINLSGGTGSGSTAFSGSKLF